MGDFAEHAEKLFALGYDVLPIPPGGKGPRLPGWSKLVITETVVRDLARQFPRAGVGIRTGRVVALDVDIRDAALASQIVGFLREQGVCTDFERIGNAPKTAFVFRLEGEPFSKIQSPKYGAKYAPENRRKQHQIECLCSGSQFVAAAIHPDTGKPYHWPEKSVLNTPLSELPPITFKECERLVGEIDARFFRNNAKLVEVHGGRKGASRGAGRVDYLANYTRPLNITVKQIKADLSAISADADDRGKWIEVGMALYHQFDGDDEGFDLWDWWSSFGDKYLDDGNDDYMRCRWGGFEPSYDCAPLTFATVKKRAHEARDKLNKEQNRPSTLFGTFSDLVKLKTPTAWLISKWLEACSLVLLFGAPGSLKTFLALSIGLAVASGRDWFGHAVRRSGAVFYLCGEGHSGIPQRLQAWSLQNKPASPNIPFYASSRAIDFTDAQAVEMMVAAIDELSASGGAVPVLIIVDTLNRAFGGADENSSADMGKFITTIDRELKARYGAAVLIVHHSGISDQGRARGSSALKGAIDTEFRLEVDGDCRRLVCTKMKNDRQPEPMVFKPKSVPLGYVEDEETLEPATSLVLERVDDPDPDPAVILKPLSPMQRKVLKALVVCLSDSRKGWIHVDEWRTNALSGGLSDSSDLESQKRAFRRARTELQKKGYVVSNEDYYQLSEAGHAGQ